MNWLERWQSCSDGQTGALDHIVNDVTQKLRLTNQVSILDVGCGSGSLLARLPAKLKKGVEPSKLLREQAISNNLNVIDGVAWKLPFEDNTFDRVLIYSVLHYMNNDSATKTISELKRVCAPGGIILVGDNADIKKYVFGPFVYSYLREPLMNLFGITRANYYSKEQFEKLGFKILPSANAEDKFDAIFYKTSELK